MAPSLGRFCRCPWADRVRAYHWDGEGHQELRAQLVAENALVPQDGCLRQTKDLVFTSPSPASALVRGRSSTGYGDWIRTTDRKRLGDVLLEP